MNQGFESGSIGGESDRPGSGTGVVFIFEFELENGLRLVRGAVVLVGFWAARWRVNGGDAPGTGGADVGASGSRVAPRPTGLAVGVAMATFSTSRW